MKIAHFAVIKISDPKKNIRLQAFISINHKKNITAAIKHESIAFHSIPQYRS